MEIIPSREIERLLRAGFKKSYHQSRYLKWPEAIKVSTESDIVILTFDANSIQSNMQDNENAFEGWILVLKELVYTTSKFQVNFTAPANIANQHYQRFLTRLWMFDSLFGPKSNANWFDLSLNNRSIMQTDCNYLNLRGTLLCNTGQSKSGRINGKITPSNVLQSLSEAELEFRLCKDGPNENCLPDAFQVKSVFRQFPVGIFKNQVTAKNNCQIFPGKKACIDLVANGQNNSFWIFELKKAGNNPLGIFSELLFYTTIVLDMIDGNIKPGNKMLDPDCYDVNNLPGKTKINACFLAPQFHPLLLDGIIDKLNTAFADLQKKRPCSVFFHKKKIDIVSGKLVAF